MVAARGGPEGLVPRARSAKDFFLHLLQDSQPRASLLSERERWLRSVRVEGREELLFEFEMLLRGIERYFNLHNLPLGNKGNLVTRDFREELADVKDALEQAIHIARRLLDPSTDHRMVFRRYVETQLADDRLRRALLEEELDQDSPAESLFLMRESFESLRTVIDHLLRLDTVSYPLFHQVGNLALRDIVLNHYFRPFRPLEFRIEYDRVKSVHVLEALRKLEPEHRRKATVAFLALFRVLHYLAYVGSADASARSRRARVVLALVQSEITTLVGFLKSELAGKGTPRPLQVAALKVARDLTQGREKIIRKTLGERSAHEDAPLHAATQLGELVRGQMGVLAAGVEVKLAEAARYEHLTAPVLMSQRLRLDLWLFSQMAKSCAERLIGPDMNRARASWAALVRYIAYFHDVSYQLLRYGDYEAVDRFTAIVLETESCPEGPITRARLAQDCHLFAQVTHELYAAVGRRTSLQGKKFEPAKAAGILARFQAMPVAG